MFGIEKEKHLGGYLNVSNLWGDPGTWSPEIWNKIIKDYHIESVGDIGCGLGYSTKYFAKKGLYVVGVEGGTNAINKSVFEGILLKSDYTKSSAFDDNYRFDLIWCCEFVEHVEEQYIDNFLNDFKRGTYIAMTYAIPGQDGWHHVNCQNKEYWIEKVNNIGFNFNEKYSNELREMAKESNSSTVFTHGCHLQNLLFFEKC